jgi:hypothetical protein
MRYEFIGLETRKKGKQNKQQRAKLTAKIASQASLNVLWGRVVSASVRVVYKNKSTCHIVYQSQIYFFESRNQ